MQIGFFIIIEAIFASLLSNLDKINKKSFEKKNNFFSLIFMGKFFYTIGDLINTLWNGKLRFFVSYKIMIFMSFYFCQSSLDLSEYWLNLHHYWNYFKISTIRQHNSRCIYVEKIEFYQQNLWGIKYRQPLIVVWFHLNETWLDIWFVENFYL